MITKTFSIKPKDVKKQWLLIDATDMVVGRLAVKIANMLRGKHKPTFTPHVDCGDNIIVINAEKVKFTGNKTHPKNGKSYFYHTGFPGGIKEVMVHDLLENHPERVIKLAVKRMLQKNTLARYQFANLYVYAGQKHPHEGQKPILFDASDRKTLERLSKETQK